MSKRMKMVYVVRHVIRLSFEVWPVMITFVMIGVLMKLFGVGNLSRVDVVAIMIISAELSIITKDKFL